MPHGGDESPSGFLPRLGPEAYRGRAVVFWTHTVAKRSTGWLNPGFHAAFRETALHTAVRENLFCPMYTLMPDHIHLIWMGVGRASDQRVATKFLRGRLTGHLKPFRWQLQPHDRVLRGEQRTKRAFADTCAYVAANPLRAGLVNKAIEWPYTGCIVAGYPDLHPISEKFWDVFWRLYNAAIAQGAIGKLISSDGGQPSDDGCYAKPETK